MPRPKKLRWKEGDWGNYQHGLFEVSPQKLRVLRPDLYSWRYSLFQSVFDLIGFYTLRDLITEHLWLGSIHPALVMTVNPGRVATYSLELDCVAILKYRSDFLRDNGLKSRSRLLGINYYGDGPKQPDIEFGPRKCSQWTGVHPIIADFVTSDQKRLAEQKVAIPEELWKRTWNLGCRRIKDFPEMSRSGVPYEH